MMKKKYIKPEMQVYEVGTQQVLTASQVNYYSNDAPADCNTDMW